MTTTNNQCGIVLLAAGASSRLGTPKQQLVFGETTLLQHSINIALGAPAAMVVVVLGAGVAGIDLPKPTDKLSFVVNNQWQEGMASSIRCGLSHLVQQYPQIQNVLFMACDQPYVSVELLHKLVTLQQETGKPVVASQYADTAGIPAIFHATLFPELMQLTGDRGARKLIERHRQDVTTVSFPQGQIDIDTGEDYQNLQKM